MQDRGARSRFGRAPRVLAQHSTFVYLPLHEDKGPIRFSDHITFPNHLLDPVQEPVNCLFVRERVHDGQPEPSSVTVIVEDALQKCR